MKPVGCMLPLEKAIAQAVAGRGRLLAFRRLATRISASVLAGLNLAQSGGRARSKRGLGPGASSAT